MKPSRSALLGPIVVSGGWMSVPGVAFAAEPIPVSFLHLRWLRRRPQRLT